MIIETAICLGASSVVALAKKARRKAKSNAALRQIAQIEEARLAFYRQAVANRYSQAEGTIQAIADERDRARQ